MIEEIQDIVKVFEDYEVMFTDKEIALFTRFSEIIEEMQ